MNIGIFGASGTIGQRIIAEASSRGHHVTAFTRDLSRVAAAGEATKNVTWKEADIFDAESIGRVLGGLDVLVNSFGPGNAARNLDDAIRTSIEKPESYLRAARAVLSALVKSPELRLIVVGGAGSLEVKPGLQLVDSPELSERIASFGIPVEFAVAVRGHRDALNEYRTSNRNWTYFSPPWAIYAGERTGRFRLGGNQLVVGEDGESRISYEDYAVALLDEVEIPRHVQRRFTIGY